MLAFDCRFRQWRLVHSEQHLEVMNHCSKLCASSITRGCFDDLTELGHKRNTVTQFLCRIAMKRMLLVEIKSVPYVHVQQLLVDGVNV